MTRKPIKTVLDTLVKIVRECDEIKMSDAAGLLNMDEKSLEALAIPLANRKILEIHYSFSGNKILKKGVNFDKTKKEEEKAAAKGFGHKDVLFTTIRRRIHEKKGILPPGIKPIDYDLEGEPAIKKTLIETTKTVKEGKKTTDEKGRPPVEEISVTESITSVEHDNKKERIIETTITETVTGYEGDHELKRLKEAFIRIRQDVERLRLKMEQEDLAEKINKEKHSSGMTAPAIRIDAI